MTALIPRTIVSDICARRDAAMQSMREALAAMEHGQELANKSLEYAQGAYGMATFQHADHSKSAAYRRIFDRIDPAVSLEAYRQQIDARVWMNLLTLTGMEHMMDRTAKADLYRDLCGNVPEVSEDNVWSTLEGLSRDAALIFSRGLAKAFIGLDRRFRSHDGFKLGTRIVLTNVFDEWGYWDWRRGVRDVITDVERVFAVLDGNKPDPKGLIDAVDKSREAGNGARQSVTEGSYFRIRGFMNGNANLWFTRDDLVEKANKVLADYYGAVLPDGVPADVTDRDIRERSTALCRDLSFYRTPDAVVARIMEDVMFDPDGTLVLEPSAGDGSIVRALLEKNGVKVHAVEVDPGRVAILRHMAMQTHRLTVLHANFLQMTVREIYTHIVMNPPFFGTHYMQHVMHAFDFLLPGGVLVAVLPATAETSETKAHKAFQEWVKTHSDYRHRMFQDLPPESFAASGTRVNTVYIKLRKRG